MGSYLCLRHESLNCTLCPSCKGGFVHFRCDLRNKAKALPLGVGGIVSESSWREWIKEGGLEEMGDVRFVHPMFKQFVTALCTPNDEKTSS